jgi:hypothetical protein
MPPTRHFVDVWNPSYASSPMEAHLAVLLDAARGFDQGQVREEDLHVWWGRVRSRNRDQPIRHLAQVREIAAELADDEDRECHLYLTDYRSLYVCHVDEITEEPVPPGPGARVPAYYAEGGLECDFWYRLFDIHRLVADDPLALITELRALRNLSYREKPVSLYGGMVDLPLIVVRPDERRFFDEANRDALTGERLWAEFDAETAGVGAMERELRENLLGDATWLALDPAARTFIATAEKIFRDQRRDQAADFGPVVNNLAKAVEVTCNLILRRVAPRLPQELRRVDLESGKPKMDLADGRHLTLGQISHLLRHTRPLLRQFVQRLENGDWFVDSLPALLGEVSKVRNPGVHREHIGRDAATALRNRLLGVGSLGDLVQLARVRPKGT